MGRQNTLLAYIMHNKIHNKFVNQGKRALYLNHVNYKHVYNSSCVVALLDYVSGKTQSR